MPKASDLQEQVLELLWSQWHELGVAAVGPRRHADDAIDPEALIAFTAAHADLDHRLRDESIDWVIKYGVYLSRTRFKNVLAEWALTGRPLVGEYAATINANGGSGWPAENCRPLEFRSRARSLLEDLSRPALLALRIRAIFGVGARAELVRALLAHPSMSMTAADLSAETNYGKRNVLKELEALQFAGVVSTFRAVNSDRFSLAKSTEVIALVGPLPDRHTAWTKVFGTIHLLLGEVRDSEGRSELQNAVSAIRLLEERRSQLLAAKIYPPSLPSGPAAWPAFLDWAVQQAKAAARI